jgi:esterase/lipase
MDKHQNIKKTGNIKLNSKSNNELILIHGYTGSPGDFGKFPSFLNKELNLEVKAIKLIGHESVIEDLFPLEYEDFLNQLEGELEKELKKGKNIFLGGYSFGAQLALDLASKYPVSGVFLFSIPYSLRFPWNIPFLEKLAYFKKKVKKTKNVLKKHYLEQSFHYIYMPSKGLSIIKVGNKRIKLILHKIKCPIIIFHFSSDLFAKKDSIKEILSSVSSKLKKGIYLQDRGHNPFFSSSKLLVFDEVSKFFKQTQLKTK